MDRATWKNYQDKFLSEMTILHVTCNTDLTAIAGPIDLYQIHRPIPDEDIERAVEQMAKLTEKGKVRYIGVSNFSPEQIKRARKIHPIASLQPS